MRAACPDPPRSAAQLAVAPTHRRPPQRCTRYAAARPDVENDRLLTAPVSTGTAGGAAAGDGSAAKRAALGGLTALSSVIYTYLSNQPELPPVGEVLGPAAQLGGVAVCAAGTGLLAAKAVMGDKLHFELHRGRLYVVAGVPSSGPPLAPGSVVVCPTGDVRGNGAFAVAPIPAGTHLGDYTGDLLDRAAFDARCPDGMGDYTTAIDDEWLIDAASIAPDTATFHPVHMNHSRGRANVGRYYHRAERRVAYFTTRDVVAGEELLYDYGRAYWRGREHLELP